MQYPNERFSNRPLRCRMIQDKLDPRQGVLKGGQRVITFARHQLFPPTGFRSHNPGETAIGSEDSLNRVRIYSRCTSRRFESKVQVLL